jgi:hypothetical protein
MRSRRLMMTMTMRRRRRRRRRRRHNTNSRFYPLAVPTFREDNRSANA